VCVRMAAAVDLCMVSFSHQFFEEPFRTPSAQETKERAAELDALDEKTNRRRSRWILDLFCDPLLKFRLPYQRVGQERIDHPIPSCRPENDQQQKHHQP